MKKLKIAIIGAGISGITLANNLKEIAMMLGFEKKWQNDWIFAKIKNNPIKSIAIPIINEDEKPVRLKFSDSNSYLSHSSNPSSNNSQTSIYQAITESQYIALRKKKLMLMMQ